MVENHDYVFVILEKLTETGCLKHMEAEAKDMVGVKGVRVKAGSEMIL